MKFVPGARIYFDCVEAFMTTADDGVTPPYSVCTKEGRWTPTKYACKLGQRIVNDAVAKVYLICLFFTFELVFDTDNCHTM
jgi:hypothetical protein